MKKLRLLLLDANIAIKLFELGLWDRVVEKWDVRLSRTVAETEAKFFERDGEQHPIDFLPNLNNQSITLFDVELSELRTFRNRFDPSYFERLDTGEAESLAHLIAHDQECLICSADTIVYKVLGLLGKREQGISLQEVLQIIGLGRTLEWPYTSEFRNKYTSDGETDGIQGFGLIR